MKKALLVLNGTQSNENKLITAAKECDFIVVCDGAFDAVRNFISPDLIVGDFDSISKENLEKLPKGKTVSFSSDKNYTDGFLGLKEIIERGYKFIEIYGGFGGRLDHEQSNILLLGIAAQEGADAVMRSDLMDLFIVSKELRISTQIGKIISLVPFTDSVHIISTKGVKYPLSNYVMRKTGKLTDKDYIMGVSNEALSAEVYVSVKNGLVLVYKQN